jgi:hypothetical protein
LIFTPALHPRLGRVTFFVITARAARDTMDPFVRLLIMMRRVAQRGVGRREYIFVTGILLFCLALGLFEHVFGWPDWLTAERPRLHRNIPLQR